jgi:hypothetical protein
MDNMTKTNYAEKQNNDQYSLEEYVDDESEVEEAVDIDIIVGMDKTSCEDSAKDRATNTTRIVSDQPMLASNSICGGIVYAIAARYLSMHP